MSEQNPPVDEIQNEPGATNDTASEPTPVQTVSPINERAPITTPVDEKSKQLPLLMPNGAGEAMDSVADQFMADVRDKQVERIDLFTKKDDRATGLVAVYVGTSGEGKDVHFLLTAEEKSVYDYLNISTRVVDSSDLKPLKQGTWSNLPELNKNPVVIGGLPPSNPQAELRQLVGIGVDRFLPMFGSGFSMHISTPSDMDKLYLQSTLASEKIEQTRMSAGFSLISSAGYLNQTFTDWALKYVKKSTAGTTDPLKLKQLMSVLDLDPLAVGIAASIWPKGYTMERRCIPHMAANKDYNPDDETSQPKVLVGCGHANRETLNINRMVVQRTDRLSESNMVQVARRSGLIDEKTIHAYRDGLSPEVARYRPVGDAGIILKLRVPTIYQAERVSTAWLDRMQARAKTINLGGNTKEARENYLIRANAIGRLMEYGCWIEEIGVRATPDDEIKVLFKRAAVAPADHPDMYDADIDMDNMIEEMSSKEDLANEITNTIREFIEQSVVTWVVLDRKNCPQCGASYKVDENNEMKHEDLISISPIELFITLLDQHLLQAARG